MSEAETEDSRGETDGSGLVDTWPRRVAVGVVALLALLAVLYALGVVGAPSAGLVDRGDWGTVTDERTEVVTTVWVDNPNPVGVALGDSLTADYVVVMNDVRLAEGERSDIAVPAGNSTHRLRTDLLNDRLAAWWVGFVRADETIELRVDGTLTVRALVAFDHDVRPVNRTILNDSTPVIDALSSSANRTAGTYTETVGTDQVDTGADGVDLGDADEVTVGYEVRRGSAEWASVTEAETTIRFRFEVHNPGDVPVPAAPDGVGVTVDTNGVRLFEGETGDLTLGSVDADTVIEPGEAREVTFTVTMDNERVDEWFTSHVRTDAGPGQEATTVSTGFQVVFEDPATGMTFRLPPDSPVTYDCQFATQILVDDQPAETTCGEAVAPAP